MQISKDQVEWAVLFRLADMLRNSRNHAYDVTLAFALFSSIVCWIAQRMRTPGSEPNDVAAKRFYERMNRETFRELAGDAPTIGSTAADAIVAIRNALAHADGSSVRPVCHVPPQGQPVLRGYAVQHRGVTHAMTPEMMIGFGTWLADEFIAEMTRGADQRPQPEFAKEVNRGVRERRH